MADEISAVNDLVTKAAEANKANASADNQEKDKSEEGKKDDSGAKADDSSKQLTTEQLAEKEAADKKILEDAEKAKVDNAGKEGAKKEDEAKPDPLVELLKETKFESLDALKAHLNKKDEKQKSPEQIKREEEVYAGNLVSYAVENELMKLEDITKYENLKGKSDEDIVYASFVTEVEDEVEAELIAERKKVGDDTKPTFEEINARIEEAFNKEYPLESENEKAKLRAQNKLAKVAREIKGPVESSYKSAKESFDQHREVANVYPKYTAKLNELIGSNVSEKLAVYSEKDGDEDVSAEIDLTEEERKSVAEKAFKKVSTPAMFKLFQEGKFDKMAEILKDETDSIIWKDYRSRGLAKVAEVFVGRGIKKGSDIGAKESFETKQAKTDTTQKADPIAAQQQVIDSTRVKK